MLNGKFLYFDQIQNKTKLGELVSALKADLYTSIKNINLNQHFNKYKLNRCLPHCNNCSCDTDLDTDYCDCAQFKRIDWEINFLSNGYLLFFGAGRTTVYGLDYILHIPMEGNTL